MVCPSVWIRRLRHYKRSLQEVWPFARIHRFKRWLKSRTRGLAICRQKSGERAREKRSVLLSRFVVFVVGSVRLSRGLSNCRPLVCPLPRRKKACPTVALSNCRLRGFPHDATAGAQTKGLSFCREPSFSSRVRSAYREVCPIVALWSALSHAAKRPVQLSRHS
jgi:hypothetical protein